MAVTPSSVKSEQSVEGLWITLFSQVSEVREKWRRRPERLCFNVGMMIRAALPSERTVIGDLRVRAYRDQSLLDAGPSYADTLRELGWGAPDEVMAAVDGETVLGTVVYVPWGPRCEAARGAREAEIRAFAVAPEAQRRGVGATLVKAVIERAEREGLDRLVLSTQEIMSGARRLYETHGFTRLSERDWSPVPGVDLLVYVRHLRG